jgi:hypothetical protein
MRSGSARTCTPVQDNVPSNPREMGSVTRARVLPELRELLETDATLHGVQLSLDLAADLPEVLVDGAQIQCHPELASVSGSRNRRSRSRRTCYRSVVWRARPTADYLAEMTGDPGVRGAALATVALREYPRPQVGSRQRRAQALSLLKYCTVQD